MNKISHFFWTADMTATFYLISQDFLQILHLFRKLELQFLDIGNVGFFNLYVYR